MVILRFICIAISLYILCGSFLFSRNDLILMILNMILLIPNSIAIFEIMFNKKMMTSIAIVSYIFCSFILLILNLLHVIFLISNNFNILFQGMLPIGFYMPIQIVFLLNNVNLYFLLIHRLENKDLIWCYFAIIYNFLFIPWLWSLLLLDIAIASAYAILSLTAMFFLALYFSMKYFKKSQYRAIS